LAQSRGRLTGSNCGMTVVCEGLVRKRAIYEQGLWLFSTGRTLTFQLSQSKIIGQNGGGGTPRRKCYATTQLTRLVDGGVPIYPKLLLIIEEKNCGRFPRADPKQVQFPPAPSMLRNDSRTIRGV